MTLTDAIAKLRELNEDVPQPLRLPTDEEVSAAEEELGVRFHPDYRRYLLEASDVIYDAVEPAQITDRDSHTSLFEVVDGAREMELPEKLLPVCEGNGGSYFCMNVRGEVVYWDHNGATDEKWPDLATWLAESGSAWPTRIRATRTGPTTAKTMRTKTWTRRLVIDALPWHNAVHTSIELDSARERASAREHESCWGSGQICRGGCGSDLDWR